ncbi:hypothetical protein HHK36_028415 [Tetracentron sinense]|uniref:Mechanosensitive ion channel MscS domain-containing protein n=1 Tax=Tetracentron sinense TaxID=13715 RepID=A0A835D3F8_TETSI|nr:hypothetical protein HHK36_028415 [Tetracentron sinense]
MQSQDKGRPTLDQLLHLMERQNTKPKQPLQTELSVCIPGEENPQTTQATTTPNVYDPSSDEDDEDYELNEKDGESVPDNGKKKKKKKKKIGWRALVEWVLFLAIMTCLICSLTVRSLKNEVKWGLAIWKWCLMVMVIFCGRLVSGWVVVLIVFLIERNFMLREKVLYFVYGLRRSFENCVWLSLVLLAWLCMFNPEVHKNHKIVGKLFRALIAILIGTFIWLLKIVLVKMLASSFHVTAFFDRMMESVFHHYILETLSMNEEQRKDSLPQNLTPSKSFTTRLRKSKNYGSSKRIDIEKLRKLTESGSITSPWGVKRLVNYVRLSGLSTISKTIDEFGKTEITSEREAKKTAHRIFKNVAKENAEYIEEDDLSKFLTSNVIDAILPLFEGAAETRRIKKSSLTNWVLQAYTERKHLANSLNDTRTAVHQLHKLASAVVLVIITVLSIMVMGLATSKVILVVTSQLLLVGFMFKNTCKTIFESIIFVFVMHPFDVGDRCVIDGVQMVVDEMNILTTVFLRYDMEKIYYPNSVLVTKPISNFKRSPDMGDSVDFTIDVSTSIENVTALEKAIQTYIERKPKYWNQKHALIVKEIEDVNKMKMSLYVQHTMNYQDFGERNKRRSKLVFELKKIFENLGIKYNLLPQKVHLTQLHMENEEMPMQS